MRALAPLALVALGWSALGAQPAEPQDQATVDRFHDAVAIGDLAAVRDMLAEDPSLATSVSDFGFQPMQLQDMYFDSRMFELLLVHGADVNSGNDEGVTLLHIITDPAAVPVLVASGADLEARDIRGWTPLMLQATNRQNGPMLVHALLLAGADPIAKDDQGETALSLALDAAGDPQIIALLRQAQGN
jgi:uncharacterized protein